MMVPTTKLLKLSTQDCKISKATEILKKAEERIQL